MRDEILIKKGRTECKERSRTILYGLKILESDGDISNRDQQLLFQICNQSKNVYNKGKVYILLWYAQHPRESNKRGLPSNQ